MRFERMPFVPMAILCLYGVVVGEVTLRQIMFPRRMRRLLGGMIDVCAMSSTGPARRAKKRQEHQPPGIERGKSCSKRRQHETVVCAHAVRGVGRLDDRILGVI